MSGTPFRGASQFCKNNHSNTKNSLLPSYLCVLSVLCGSFISPLELTQKINLHIWDAPVFSGVRVPIQTLLDYLKAGDSIDNFLDGFPTVSREQVITFLEEVEKAMISSAPKV
ncbi:MAG: DUF433 domain-containing protein [Nostocales cyanobacterium]|nr:MAG: DUF433 domain-containing protein [Nostocales cyanobacterium]